MRLSFIFLLAIPFIFDAQAKPLDEFFKSLGGQTNSSSAGSYRDQAAGYYTGGGYAMRQSNTVIQPINISLPRLGLGCNSIDMYFGSLSFLQTEKLVQLFRQLGTGIPLYGMQLAVKTHAPQIENILAQNLKKIQDLNATSLNSCHLSQQIIGGLTPKGTAASEQICMDQKQLGENKLDIFGAREHCSTPQSLNAQVKDAKDKYKDLLMGEYNLVWHVLQKMDGYKGDENKELANFIMSVTGTLISIKEGDKFRLKIIEPRADQKDFLGAYLKGGTTSALTCNETNKCLAPQITHLTVSDEMTMKSKVIQKIGDLRAKYISKDAITDSEIHFLNDAVNVPIYRYIQVSVAAGTVFMMQDAAEYIGANILLTQFDRVMSEVIEAVDALQKIQLEDTAIAEFKMNLQLARGRVQAALIGVNNGSIHLLNQMIQSIEQSIIAKNS